MKARLEALAEDTFLSDDLLRQLMDVGEVDLLVGISSHGNASTTSRTLFARLNKVSGKTFPGNERSSSTRAVQKRAERSARRDVHSNGSGKKSDFAADIVASHGAPCDCGLFGPAFRRNGAAHDSRGRGLVAGARLRRGFPCNRESHARLNRESAAACLSRKIRFCGAALHAAQISRIARAKFALSDEPRDLRLQNPRTLFG